MNTEKYFAIVINGVERFFRTNRKDANRVASKHRSQHGAYNVWIRPHYRLLNAQGDIVNL